jgi:hypothetical protein
MPPLDYKVTSFIKSELKIQLKFTNTNTLSTSTSRTKDLITVSLNNTQFLLSEQNELAQDLIWRVSTTLPVQVQDT